MCIYLKNSENHIFKVLEEALLKVISVPICAKRRKAMTNYSWD